MAGPIQNGIYEIVTGGGAIVFSGEGRRLNILPKGSSDPAASRINVRSDGGQGYIFQFVGGRFVTFENEEPSFNNHAIGSSSGTPWTFLVEPQEYGSGYMIAKNPQFKLGYALERIYPPWVAMIPTPEAAVWEFVRVD